MQNSFILRDGLKQKGDGLTARFPPWDCENPLPEPRKQVQGRREIRNPFSHTSSTSSSFKGKEPLWMMAHINSLMIEGTRNEAVSHSC